MTDQENENPATISGAGSPPASEKPAAPAVADTPEHPAAPAAGALRDTKNPGKNVADRPHWITILIGFVSPSVAIVALIISLQSLNTSKQSLEIGQRAYVSLLDGKLTFNHMTIGPPPGPSLGIQLPGAVIQSEQGPIATMLLSVNVVNSGNTPAEFTTFTPTFKHLPDGWSVRNPDWQAVQKTPRFLGAKSQGPWEFHQDFSLTPQAWTTYLRAGPRPGLYFSGELRYLDVFHTEHTVDWCWMTLADERNEGYVTDCDAMTFERTKQ